MSCRPMFEVDLRGVRTAIVAAAAVLGAACSPPADTSYLAEMPEAQRVLIDFVGKDPVDTAALQFSALTSLQGAILYLARSQGRSQLTPEELAKATAYAEEAQSILQGIITTADPQCKGPRCPAYRFGELNRTYIQGPVFARRVVEKYFSEKWRKVLLATSK